jgi:GNAT superfamily N-acetyltransferase
VEGTRPAGPEDVATCARLIAAARAAAAQMRGGPELLAAWRVEEPGDPSALEAAVGGWLADGRHVVLAGVFDDVVVGVGVGHVTESAGEPLGVVDCVYVEPDARNVGVGSALTGALVAAFAGRGCGAVDTPALPGDRSTKQRFEAAGFSARLLVLHRRLP